jgi:hypothetical protein
MCEGIFCSQCTHLRPILSITALEKEKNASVSAAHKKTLSLAAAPLVPPAPGKKTKDCHSLHSCVHNSHTHTPFLHADH